jgi:hypothetical protein
MSDSRINRRDLSRLALAALGGLFTGAIVGCSGSKDKDKDKDKKSEDDKKDKDAAPGDTSSRLLEDPHVCRGINTCKNKGKKGTTNECAGQAHCATVAAHDCQGMNDCKGQGGCGNNPGENKCKGQGGCQVPLSAKTWPKARKRFEELMGKASKKFAEAPTN